MVPQEFMKNNLRKPRDIAYFQRKPRRGNFSIEELFDVIRRYLPSSYRPLTFVSRYESNGIIKRLFICYEAWRNQKNINHLTGDIHFAVIFFKKKKTILTLHDIGRLSYGVRLNNLLYWFFWFYLPVKRVKFVTVISERTKTQLLNIVKIPESKVKVIPNCISPIFKPNEKRFLTEKPILLQIGTKINKNLDRLIKALQGISCELRIIGPLSKNQIKLLIDYGICSSHTHDISHQDILREYEKADIVTLVSTMEGFGVPIVEANAIGRVVITSEIEPMRWVAGNAALLVNPFDFTDIRKGLIKLIDDQQLREGLIANGFANARRFHPRAVVSQYVDLYNQL